MEARWGGRVLVDSFANSSPLPHRDRAGNERPSWTGFGLWRWVCVAQVGVPGRRRQRMDLTCWCGGG
ncbi:hypothetical protein TIFTF001_011189 [Ficus carica]|uniref:Uncharacterized protein n=1 Tax=Ficus carica TaxID=3494 RepID=A0AA88D2M7_FICCA|nr:hypothetical protein TIFTF001_011189 [Ficus carica]